MDFGGIFNKIAVLGGLVINPKIILLERGILLKKPRLMIKHYI